jgi:8-oxo-dGTP pyrophosphatase MutT (NUDIX family)
MKKRWEQSAGGVVYKKDGKKLLFLLGKHSGYHKWVLPKGLIEPGETPKVTAVREIKEEMGVEARVIRPEPIHIETYSYTARYKKPLDLDTQASESTRRIQHYQEQGEGDTLVEKTVTFYLLVATAGDPKDHGWEMESAGWFSYEAALKKMSFKGEKVALQKAWELLSAV